MTRTFTIFLYQDIFIAMETFIVSFTSKTFITVLFNINCIYQGLSMLLIPTTIMISIHGFFIQHHFLSVLSI